MTSRSIPSVTNNRYDAVIIANGEYPFHEIPLSIIEKAEFVVCCDGATNTAVSHGVTPSIIVGDLDSISTENKKIFSDRLIHVPDQNTNDLTKAVDFCISKGRRNIAIVAASGKREDHAIANIFLLARYMKECVVCMITDYGCFNATYGISVFEGYPGQQISIFSIDRTPITTTNLKFPVDRIVLEYLWQGTLNESLADKFTIESAGRIIVFSQFSQSL